VLTSCKSCSICANYALILLWYFDCVEIWALFFSIWHVSIYCSSNSNFGIISRFWPKSILILSKPLRCFSLLRQKSKVLSLLRNLLHLGLCSIKMDKSCSSFEEMELFRLFTLVFHLHRMSLFRDLLQQCGIGADTDSNTSSASPSSLASSSQPSRHRVLVFAQLKSSLDLLASSLFDQLMPSVQYMRLDGMNFFFIACSIGFRTMSIT
jgi:SNF2 family DNA or RNA helicase